MDIPEMKLLKTTMEAELKDIICDFQNRTGLTVEDIDLIHTGTNSGEMPPYSTFVNTSVKL